MAVEVEVEAFLGQRCLRRNSRLLSQPVVAFLGHLSQDFQEVEVEALLGHMSQTVVAFLAHAVEDFNDRMWHLKDHFVLR